MRSSANISLLTLAALTAKTGALFAAAAGALRVMSASATWSLTDLTANDGPIVFGYAHSDYTVTEIKECIEASGAIDLGDKIAQERANRLVRVVGVMNEVRETINDGEPVKTRLNWRFNPGEVLNVFAYNDNADDALTTLAELGHNGVLWVKDV